MKYKLTKADYEDIRVIIAVTESIFNHYKNLSQLEIEGKKETAEYQQAINELASTIGMEFVIYERIGSRLPKIEAIIEELKKQSRELLELNDLDFVIGEKSNYLTIKRILNRLADSLSFQKELSDYLEETQENDMKNEEIIQQIFSSLMQKSTIQMSGVIEIAESLRDDQYHCFLSILGKMIDSIFCKDIRPELILAKYRLSFINATVEKQFVKNHFVTPSQVYLQSIITGEIKGISPFFLSMEKSKFGHNFVREQTDTLLSFFDNQTLLDPKMKAKAMIRSCILRTGLLFLTDEEIMSENDRFHTLIDTETYLSLHPRNQEIENIIMNSYRNLKQDRMIPIEVSFKRKS